MSQFDPLCGLSRPGEADVCRFSELSRVAKGARVVAFHHPRVADDIRDDDRGNAMGDVRGRHG